jgi:hypothetical protein
VTVQFSGPGKVFETLVETLMEDTNVDGLAVQLHRPALVVPKGALEVFERTVHVRSLTPVARNLNCDADTITASARL